MTTLPFTVASKNEISRNKPRQASEAPLQWELTLLPKKEIEKLEYPKTALLMYW